LNDTWGRAVVGASALTAFQASTFHCLPRALKLRRACPFFATWSLTFVALRSINSDADAAVGTMAAKATARMSSARKRKSM